jgi:hypothetical protein
MKNLFTIDDSERQRIIEMHLSATKNGYLISESQINETDPPSTGGPVTPNTSVDVKTGTSSAASKQNLKDVLKLNNKFYFNTGKTGLDKDSIRNFQEVQNFLTKAKEYLSKSNKPFQISWVASESQTPKTGSDVNTLSQKRGGTLGDYFRSQLEKLPSWPKGMSSVSGRYKQGSIPYKQGVDNPQDPKYLNDQWVEINIWTN